jgi:N-hydroxyarylamine O-acetyltransferase
MNVEAYLQRIRYHRPLMRGTDPPKVDPPQVDPTKVDPPTVDPPSIDLLRSLHRAHLFTVPFENLDIGQGREITCDETRILHKIVNEHRGGFCYELNGAFAALLRTLGFRVTLLSARVAREDGSHGPEFDHLTLRVDLDEPWLADVGFGECFLEPLRLESRTDQPQNGRVYRLTGLNSEDGLLSLEAMVEGKWKRQYAFTLQPRELSEFARMCHYHQTSPESHFTRQRICSLATPEGRITLSDGKLIETRAGVREERLLAGEEEWRLTLRERFGVILSA